MTINDMLDEIHRIASKLHGVGIGLQYKEDRPGEHFLTLYRSRFKDGNVNLEKEDGTSYDDVVMKMHTKLLAKEADTLTQEKAKAIKAEVTPSIVVVKVVGAHEDDDRDSTTLSALEEPGARYCFSLDGELWLGDQPSELAAFLVCCDLYKVNTCWVAQRKEPDVQELLGGVSDEVIRLLQFEANEQHDGTAVGWLTSVTHEEKLGLERALMATVENWLLSSRNMPDFFSTHPTKVQAANLNGIKAAINDQ